MPKVILGLSVVACTLAVGVGSANAETGANWMVNGSNVSATLLPVIQNNGAGVHVVILTEASKIKIEFLCDHMGIAGFLLALSGDIPHGLAFFLYGCKVLLNKKLSSACEPHTGVKKGEIITKELKGLIVLHKLANGTLDPIIRIEPASGETLAKIETGEECAIGEAIPLIGKFTLQDANGQLTSEAVTHLMEQGPLTELWVISKTAEHTARIDGSFSIELGGSRTGLKWSGLPA